MCVLSELSDLGCGVEDYLIAQGRKPGSIYCQIGASCQEAMGWVKERDLG
jgi:hypothetical protein